jgi:hypothetical protein
MVATWIVVNLMTSTGGSLNNKLLLVSGKILGFAFTEKGRKHEGNMGVGLDVSAKRFDSQCR